MSTEKYNGCSNKPSLIRALSQQGIDKLQGYWTMRVEEMFSKRFILFALIIANSLSLFAQSELRGAMGLFFGMNENAVKGVVGQVGGIFETAESGTLLITNVTMGTRKPVMVTCKFVKHKLYEISVYFIASLEAKTQELYDEISGIVDSKYGKGQSLRNFKGLYKDGDGFEMEAVKTGNASIACSWNNFINSNIIYLEICSLSDNLYVRLTYRNDILAAKAEEQRAIKEKADF